VPFPIHPTRAVRVSCIKPPLTTISHWELQTTPQTSLSTCLGAGSRMAWRAHLWGQPREPYAWRLAATQTADRSTRSLL